MDAVLTTTWVEVADNAVKIGLGGFVAGGFALIVARHQASRELQKLKFERRSKILSDAASKYEDSFQSWFRYSSMLPGLALVATNQNQNLLEVEISRAYLSQEITKTTDMRVKMQEAFQKSFYAQSSLLLLGEKECVRFAEALSTALISADASYKFNGETCDLTNFMKVGDQVRSSRKEFYASMHKAFEKSG